NHLNFALDKEIILKIIQFGKTKQNNLILFDHYLGDLVNIEITEWLSAFGAPLDRIDKNGGQIDLPKDDLYISIANKLSANAFTGKVKVKEKKVVIFLKYK